MKKYYLLFISLFLLVSCNNEQTLTYKETPTPKQEIVASKNAESDENKISANVTTITSS